MMKKLLAGIFLLTHILAYGQYMPLNFGARISVTSVTPTAPHTYRITGLVQDNLSKWNASDVQASQDSVYHLGGSNLYNYRISSIQSAAGNSITMTLVDQDSTGDYPSTETEWAVVKFTPANKFPYWLSGVSDNLNSAIQNRFVQRLDEITASVTPSVYLAVTALHRDSSLNAFSELKNGYLLIPGDDESWYLKELTLAVLDTGTTVDTLNIEVRKINLDRTQPHTVLLTTLMSDNPNIALGPYSFQVNAGEIVYLKTAQVSAATKPKGMVFAVKLSKTP